MRNCSCFFCNSSCNFCNDSCFFLQRLLLVPIVACSDCCFYEDGHLPSVTIPFAFDMFGFAKVFAHLTDVLRRDPKRLSEELISRPTRSVFVTERVNFREENSLHGREVIQQPNLLGYPYSVHFAKVNDEINFIPSLPFRISKPLRQSPRMSLRTFPISPEGA